MVDPDVVAVSPSGLDAMTGALRRSLNASTDAASALRTAFARANADPRNVDAIYRILGLAADEIPMLYRRHRLALAIDADASDPFAGMKGRPRGMVVAGAGPLTYGDDATAARAGTADADAIAKTFDAGGALMPAVDGLTAILRHIAVNNGDPAYADALIDRLGPSLTAHLGALGLSLDGNGNGNGNGDHEHARLVRTSVGGALATASHHLPNPGIWLAKSVYAGQPGPTTALVAPFLSQGGFDFRFLAEVGRAELATTTLHPDPLRSSEIWNAIANDPKAAALLYGTSLPEIMQYADESRPLGPHEGRAIAAFARLEQAATIDVRRTDPRAADTNVKAIIDYFNAHPEYHTYDSMRNVNAGIITDRWADLVYSIGSPVDLLTNSGDDPTREGVELPPNAWKNYLTDTMRHGPSAARLFFQSLSWVESAEEDIDRKRMPMNHTMRTPDGQKPNFWEAQNIDRVEALMNASGADALAQLKSKNSAMVEGWISGVKLVTSEVRKNNINLFGYEKDVGKIWLDSQAAHLEDYSKRLIRKNFGDSDEHAVGDVLNDTPFEYRKDWRRQAVKNWNAAVNSGYTGLSSVKYDGRSWNGDPRTYEEQYGTRFTRTDGHHKLRLLDVEDIRGDWKKLAAFNAWLRDPAVANSVHGSGSD